MKTDNIIENGGSDGQELQKRLSWPMTGIILVSNMAGAGFLSLPMAISNSGWLGFPMMIIFCLMVGYSGTRLGVCWEMLEERWPDQYAHNIRQPYRDIAFRAMGVHGGRIAGACVKITLLGGTTVFLALLGSFTESLFPVLSSCAWSIILGVCLIPLSWLGTPKDFWQSSVVAVLATVVACGVVVVELLLYKEEDVEVVYPNPTVSSFSLGFGAILFAYAGASIFPTVQHDMEDRTHFWKSVVLCFSLLLTLYLPVAATGYLTFGSSVTSNILLNLTTNYVTKAAVAFQVVNLIGTYLITINPVYQGLEDILGFPHAFGVKRIVLRSSVVLLEVVVVLTIPEFSLILQLVGGSTVTMCSFVLPPLMYMRLAADHSNEKWRKRNIPLWEKVLLWEIIIIGIIGGIMSTVSAFQSIIDVGLGISCFVDFSN